MEKKTVFERLSAINVNDHVEKKDNLTYLSWAWAWSEVKKACPDATYKIGDTEYDEATGFMCHTTVTIEGETLEMWLPVMDGKNKSMKKVPYDYNTKYGLKTVEAATTFDINKTIMRCLVKNLAMFGLGIYIYAGEDLPEVENVTTTQQKNTTTTDDSRIKLVKDSDNYNRVVKYMNDNKDQTKTALLQQIERKYILSDAIKKQLISL